MESEMSEPSDYFLLPGGNEIAALCHVARTQIRRGERRLITLAAHDPDCVEDYIIAYINRLSDLHVVIHFLDKSMTWCRKPDSVNNGMCIMSLLRWSLIF